MHVSAHTTFEIRSRANNNTPAAAAPGRPRNKEDVTKQEALGNVRAALQRVNQSPLRPTVSHDLSAQFSDDVLEFMRELHLTVLRMKQRQKTGPLGGEDWKSFETGLKLLSGTMEINEPGSKAAGTEKLDVKALQRQAQQYKDSREEKKSRMKARQETLAEMLGEVSEDEGGYGEDEKDGSCSKYVQWSGTYLVTRMRDTPGLIEPGRPARLSDYTKA
ncbi:uncharacterized protein MYCFIDRAFT_78230 [Pseudocercospora fijiensis CIRAD86]|uniref:Uncharacterized protein n=1 Tax=Pseudocercospora fijiensis (strain CIRAD86) TaxID=383855 RepID=M2ZN35_PSEFD|nr:uncharacterized protein MYCFIDRAFT_78230 [Pseudocercospora fijiensis CIRAD86]EME80519.1 hypothetical protein MYCFIDRAFT_78230 [Pseudocercospora fijiensis CIRAD86]